MFSKIKALLSSNDSTESATVDVHDEVLAATMLLIEVAWADHEIEERELRTIEHALSDLYEIEEAEIVEVIDRARTMHESSTGVYPFTKLLNEELEPAEKRRLLVHLWRMNTFDETEFHYEEHMIRRIADLLYCTHDEFIVAKLEAQKTVS